MPRTPIVYTDGGDADSTEPADAGRAVPRWFRGPDPDTAQLRALYLEQGLYEWQAAQRLGISKARLVAALEAAGIPRRVRRKVPCPLTVEQLRRLVDGGGTAAGLAREYEVSASTARRWLAEAGVLPADPD